MQFFFYCLVFLSTVSVAVLFEVKKIYVIERDFKTGVLRARRQNVPSHTMARIGGLDHHLQQQQQQQQQHMFNVAVSPPPLQATSGQLQQQPSDLASTVDLTADNRTPIDYLTPPPNADFRFQNFQPSNFEQVNAVRAESNQNTAAATVVQAPVPPPLAPFAAPLQQAPLQQTSAFAPSGTGGSGGFASAQAQPPPASQIVQASSPSNQVHSLTFANPPPLEQFTPYTPTLVQEPAPNVHHQQQQQQTGVGGRWELGFDASDILTPPFAISVPEQSGGGGQAIFHQDFGQEVAGSVRNNKQFLGASNFDASTAANSKFTPLDAIVRTSSSNNNVYWGTPKTAQQQPLRPPISFAEPNAFRFNNPHHHPPGHHNNNHHHHHQYVDTFQMPFTGQFDGPLSQGTVADHVVHSSFRIKRQLRRANGPPPAPTPSELDDIDENDRFGDRKPVYSFVKTDRNGNFKWSVRHGY